MTIHGIKTQSLIMRFIVLDGPEAQKQNGISAMCHNLFINPVSHEIASLKAQVSLYSYM